MDTVLEHLGDYLSHDAIHDLSGAEEDEADKLEGDASDSEDETAVAADNEEAGNEEESAGSDGDDVTAVEAVGDGLATDAAHDKTSEAIVALSRQQADAVHQNQVQIASLQGAIEAIKATGQLRMVQHMERDCYTEEATATYPLRVTSRR